MRRLEQTVGGLLVATCLMLATVQLAITISTLLSSSLIHPLHDQFRLNLRYLTEPFPLSILLLENGHRPVLPGLVRVAELKWLGGWQWLQFTTAWGLAAACTVVIMRDMRRAWPPLIFVAGSMLAIVLVWWNAHARMFIHVYEAVHLFYILGGLISSVCIAHAAASHGWPFWWHLSWLACVLAVFSFGPGIATFAALFAVAVLLRAPIRVLATLSVVLAITLWIYVYALPGAEGVRNASGGLPAGPVAFHLFARLGAPAHEMLRVLDVPTGVALGTACVTGGFVSAVLAIIATDILRGQSSANRITLLGIGMLVFGASANALIAINRTDYFLQHPDQLFADRYLFWASLTWLGAAIVLLQRAAGRPLALQCAVGTVAALFSAAAIPASVWLSGWSAEVYRHVERTAVGMQVGVASDHQIAAIADAGVPVATGAVSVMRQGRLSGYQDVPAGRFVLQLSSSPEHLPWISLQSSPDRRQFSGQLAKSAARSVRHEWLWLVDEHGIAHGIAAPTHSVSGPRNALRIGRPTLDGIEGYWLGRPVEVAWIGVRDGAALRVVARVRQDAMNRASVS